MIDADYRGEVKVIMVNHGPHPKVFEVGDRVAQIIIEKIAEIPMVVSSELSSTSRGGGGFGSSGIVGRSGRGWGEPVPDPALHARGEPRDEGGPHDSGDPQPERRAALSARGAPGHEGTLFDEGVQVHEGGMSGTLH